MREIKFRAWDKKQKSWVKEDEFNILPDGTVREWYGFQDDMGGECWEPTKDYIVMQYTGLKDKHGTEIYEGDVVLIEDTWTETVDVGVGSVPVAQQLEKHIAEVIFSECCWGVEIKESKEILHKGFHSFRSIEEDCGDHFAEIIGNVYENPELIK